MAINYTKYLDSTGTHYIANSGHDENNRYHGGQAGDQTGHEAELKAWYYRPWTVVLRYPDPAVGLCIAKLEVAMCLNNKIGYDQYQRKSYWNELVKAGYDPSAITTACEQDCTGGTTANVKAAGHIMGLPALEDIPVDTYSGNMRARFVKAGFKALTGNKYLSGPNYLLPGDVLLYEGHHAAVNITYGKYADRTAVDIPEKPEALKLGDRILKNGMRGADVKALQAALIKLGYDCGRWGADGDFGDCTEMAVRRFQTQEDLAPDGEFGPLTLAALNKALKKLSQPVEKPRYVLIVGGNCYVRSEPSTDGSKRGIAYCDAKLPYGGQTAANGWLSIIYKDKIGWVSGKYGRLVE